MWASGGPQQRAATTTMTPLMLKFGIELGACQGLDLLMEEQVAGLCAVGVRKSETGPAVATKFVETVPALFKTFQYRAGKKLPRPR